MAVYIKQRFEQQTLTLDTHSFNECYFYRCTLIYTGGPTPAMIGCTFIECHFRLEGAARNTVEWFAALYASGGFPRQLVEQAIGIHGDNEGEGQEDGPPEQQP